MKVFLWIMFLASAGSIITGFILKPHEWSEKLIGLGTLVLFVIVIPLFSYYRWKDRKLQDYMLTKENIDKMRKNNDL
ncbi:MAG: hypothetical protein HKN96_07540 [Flavobacteriaceae bacterium]|nr:hypothetical protein [Bacteroidia bacterium]NND11047.1 hypothetical protein [Flavobacteriaceae bacterium]NNK27377.1 hypothetical protein [Flavobacteriaceae bacterium]NNL61395.1 hypothetical protein [Flavobacteriaceae bacterium]